MTTYVEINGTAVINKANATAEATGQIFFDSVTNKWYITESGGAVKQVETTN